MKIELNNVYKKIKDAVLLDNINLSIDRVGIYGIIGTNGSGKTMLLRVISGLVIPTSGEVIVDSKKLHEDISFPNNMGLLIEKPGFLDYLSGLDNLVSLAAIQKKIDKEKIKEYMNMLGLESDEKKPVKTYSLGMKQRLGIAQAIMENPDLIMLDEPFNGLDESGIKDVRDILLELKGKGKTIILTSHNKEDINLLCDYVYKMKEGMLV